MTNHVLLIEDDTELRKSLTQTLELEDFTVISAASYIEAKTHISPQFTGVILSDMRMPGKDGFDVLSFTKTIDQQLPVIVLTGEADVPMAVRAIGEGAYDFLQKPCPPDQLIDALNRAIAHRDVVLRSRNLEQKLRTGDAAATNFPGPSEITENLRNKLRQSSGLPVNVFLHGPNGAGKRLAAHTLHTLSGANRHFISLATNALTPLEISQTPIPDMPIDLSAKWLEHTSYDQQVALFHLIETHPNIRLIASAKQSLNKLRTQGLIDDLYFSLNLMVIEVPSLSQRKKDLTILFEALVRQSIRGLNADMPMIPDSLYTQVISRTWPENLPELRNFAHSFALGLNVHNDRMMELTLSEQITSFEKMVLTDTLKRMGGKAVQAANALGLPRKTFYDKMAKHGIKAKDFRDLP